MSPTTTPPSCLAPGSRLQQGRWEPRQSLWSEELRRQSWVWGTRRLNSARKTSRAKGVADPELGMRLRLTEGRRVCAWEGTTPNQGKETPGKKQAEQLLKLTWVGNSLCADWPEWNVLLMYRNWVKSPEGYCLSSEANFAQDSFSGPTLTKPKSIKLIVSNFIASQNKSQKYLRNSKQHNTQQSKIHNVQHPFK